MAMLLIRQLCRLSSSNGKMQMRGVIIQTLIAAAAAETATL